MQNTNKDPIKNSGEKKNEPKTSIWNIEKDELDKQVNQYYRLKLHQSYRGISTLLLSFGLLFNVILQVVLNTSFQVLAIEVAFASLLIYFIYRGHRWAMGLFILSFTVNLLITSFERVLAGSFSVSSTIILVEDISKLQLSDEHDALMWVSAEEIDIKTEIDTKMSELCIEALRMTQR